MAGMFLLVQSCLGVTGSFQSTGSMITARALHTATLLMNGKVLVAGGVADTFDSAVLASAELYDPVTGTWTNTGSMAVGRASHTAVLLSSGKVLVCGGFNSGFGPLASAELYDPASGTWSTTGSLVEARYYQPATLLARW